MSQAHSPPVLPDWAPGHHVNTPSRDADVDRHISTEDTWTDQDRGADRGFDHVLTLPDYPINDVWEEHYEGDYSYTDESPATESSSESHCTASRQLSCDLTIMII